MGFCTNRARWGRFGGEEEGLGSCGGAGGDLGAQLRFSITRPFVIARGVFDRRLQSHIPGPHLLLLKVSKRLLIYRQKMGTWDLRLLASTEDEPWCWEALLSLE